MLPVLPAVLLSEFITCQPRGVSVFQEQWLASKIIFSQFGKETRLLDKILGLTQSVTANREEPKDRSILSLAKETGQHGDNLTRSRKTLITLI